MLVAVVSAAISKRTLKIAEAEYGQKLLKAGLYLVDAVRFSLESQPYCAFAITITNHSTSPLSFVTFDLEVEYLDENATIGKAFVAPVLHVMPLGIAASYIKLIPTNLGPREAATGWLTYRLPTSTHRRYRLGSYKIVGKTSDGNQSDVSAHLLRDVTHEN